MAWPNGSALQSVADYARANEVAFPKLPELYKLYTETYSLVWEPLPGDRQDPMVIYLPVTINNGEINNAATYNGINILRKVSDDNDVDGVRPTDLKQVALSDYPTKTTGLDVQHAVNLMALTEHNVLRNGERIRHAICTRAFRAAR